MSSSTGSSSHRFIPGQMLIEPGEIELKKMAQQRAEGIVPAVLAATALPPERRPAAPSVSKL